MAERAVVAGEADVEARGAKIVDAGGERRRCGRRSRASLSWRAETCAADSPYLRRPRYSWPSARNGVWPMPPATMIECVGGLRRKTVAERAPDVELVAGLCSAASRRSSCRARGRRRRSPTADRPRRARRRRARAAGPTADRRARRAAPSGTAQARSAEQSRGTRSARGTCRARAGRFPRSGRDADKQRQRRMRRAADSVSQSASAKFEWLSQCTCYPPMIDLVFSP